MARSTCIPLRTIALLESGEFDALPAEVFARGFLRCYADRIGLDPDATLRAYDLCRELGPSRSCGGGATGRATERGRVRTWASRAMAALIKTRARSALSALALLALGLLALRFISQAVW